MLQAGKGSLDAATLRSLADAVLAGAPQPGAQSADAAQNLDYSSASADALARQLAQMQMQNQQVNYSQQVWFPLASRLVLCQGYMTKLKVGAVVCQGKLLY